MWATELDSLTHIKPNQTVEVIRGAKGNLTILEREQPRNIGGQGLKPVRSRAKITYLFQVNLNKN